MLQTVFLIIAAVCFFLQAAGVRIGTIDLNSAGFGFVTVAFIV